MWCLPKARAPIIHFTSWKQLNVIKMCFVLLPSLVLSASKEKLNSCTVSSLIYLPKQFFVLLFDCRICWMVLTDSNFAPKCGSRYFFAKSKLCEIAGFYLFYLTSWPRRAWACRSKYLIQSKISLSCFLLIFSCSLALTSLWPDQAVLLLCFFLDTNLYLAHHHELTAFLCHWRFSCLSNSPHITVDDEVNKVYV